MMRSAIFNANETVSAGEVSALTGIYPQKAMYWRKTRGFPRSDRGTYQTSEIVAYLRARGWEVKIV